jgi:hypothetical protein
MATEPFTPSESTPSKPARSKSAELQVRVMLWLTLVFGAGILIYSVFPEGNHIREIGTAAMCCLLVLIMFRSSSSRN